MQKLLIASVLAFGLGMQQVACAFATQPALNVQADVETLIVHAQRNNLSAEQTLKLAKESIDQAAHIESAELEVEGSNKRTLLIVAGVVVVVVVVAGVAYYFYKKKSAQPKKLPIPKISTAREAAEEVLKNLSFASSFDELMSFTDEMIQKNSLSLEEKAHVLRVRSQLVRDGEMAANEAILSGEVRTEIDGRIFTHKYLRENLLKAVAESYGRPLTPADLEKARR